MRPLAVRWKLALGFAAAVAVVLAVTGVLMRVSLARELDAGIDRELRIRADEVAALAARTTEPRLAEGGTERLAEAEESFSQILDGTGRVLDASPSGLRSSLLDRDALRAAQADAATFTVDAVSTVGHRARVLARPASGAAARIIVVGTSLEDRDEAVAGLTGILLVGIPIVLAVVSALGYLLARFALGPVEAMRREASALSAARAGDRLSVPEARDELRRLAETLNDLLARVEGALARERTFVADASHELRTPLAILRTEIDLALAGERSPDELRAALASAGEETVRLSRLAEDLLVLARAEDGGLPVRPEDLGARELLDDVVRAFAPAARAAGRSLRVDVDPSLRLVVDRLRMRQAVGNLVDNALRHGQGDVVIGAATTDGQVEIVVTDAGPGIEDEIAGRAFERFSRGPGARAGSGSGLGLAIVRAVARSHGGDAWIARSAAGGTAAGIRLPAAAAHRVHA